MAVEIPKTIKDLPTSSARWIGQDVSRIEDPSLVTGQTEYIDNVVLPGMLHCAILRSTYPHAKIKGIDSSAAAKLPGVVAVLTGEDVLKWSNPASSTPEGWGMYCLATDKVRFVGEPVAAVAAVSRYVAEDALELIDVDYEPLLVVSDPRKALEENSPLIFEEHNSNAMLQRVFTWGDVDKLFEEADEVVNESFRWNRVGANPMETFGVVAQWDVVNGSVTCRGSYQAPSLFALGSSAVLGLPANKLKFISQPHGGSFGGKGQGRGTNIACLLSRKSGGRPVKWIEDRMEYLLAGYSQAWDRHYDASIALTKDGTITGFKVTLLDDMGASAENFGSLNVIKPLAAFTGCYTIQAAQYDLTLVATNKTPASPYRGMGPPPHFFVLESLIDIAARKMGIDPAELRRKNYIQPDQFPYTIPSGNEYDSGNYEAALDTVLEMAQYAKLREEQAKAREEGRYLGIGVVSTVEPGVMDLNAYRGVGMQGVGVPEGATVSIDILGNITARISFSLEGQGQYTLIAQLLADYFGVEMSAINVVYADTHTGPPSFGPGGSRLGVAITGATLGAAEKLRVRLTAMAANLLQTTPENIEMQDGFFRAKGMPGVEMPLAQVAGAMLGASHLLPPGMEPNGDATYVWTAPGRTEPDDQGRCKSYLTAANACHVVLVEVDPETGKTQILKYWIADDCGTRLNPGTVEGQIQGGVAQGVGAALLEEYVYDEDGQPLVSTFMDYLMPTINEVPMTEKSALCTPSPFAPLGAKGCGEGAIHTTPAAIMCAINDALMPFNILAKEVPASPNRVWKLIQGTNCY